MKEEKVHSPPDTRNNTSRPIVLQYIGDTLRKKRTESVGPGKSPHYRMAAFRSLASMEPEPPVSNRSNASL